MAHCGALGARVETKGIKLESKKNISFLEKLRYLENSFAKITYQKKREND